MSPDWPWWQFTQYAIHVPLLTVLRKLDSGFYLYEICVSGACTELYAKLSSNRISTRSGSQLKSNLYETREIMALFQMNR